MNLDKFNNKKGKLQKCGGLFCLILVIVTTVPGPNFKELLFFYRNKKYRSTTIELFIRTRGRTGEASCPRATGLQGDTRAYMRTRVEYEVHVGVCAY